MMNLGTPCDRWSFMAPSSLQATVTRHRRRGRTPSARRPSAPQRTTSGGEQMGMSRN